MLHNRIRPFVLTLRVPALLFAGAASAAEFCQPGTVTRLGRYPDLLPETSGMAFSIEQPGRVYHVNDERDENLIYFNDAATIDRDFSALRIVGFKPVDVEDLSVGPCPGQTSCLFIADIGDNHEARKTLQVAVIAERDDFDPETNSLKRWFHGSQYRVEPERVLTLAYPDGRKNAESLAVHPNGDIYLFSKAQQGRSGPVSSTRFYRLPREQWQHAAPDTVLTLTLLGEIDMRELNAQGKPWEQILTAVDIHPSGRKFAALTGGPIFEFLLDLSAIAPGFSYSNDLSRHQRIAVAPLRQQEALGYNVAGDAIYFSSEGADKGYGYIAVIRCQDGVPASGSP